MKLNLPGRLFLKISTLLFLLFSSPVVFSQIKSKAFKATIDALNSRTVPYISVAELARQPGGLVLLDARPVAEFSVSHLPGARRVGYEDFSVGQLHLPDRNTPIVVYCSVGYRSEKVGEQLQKAGFTNVKNLYGGLFEWVNQGHGVVDTAGRPTQRVHAYNRLWGVWLSRGEKIY